MWYVVQVYVGNETKIQSQCQRKIKKQFLEECFIPMYEEKKRIQGEWVVQKKVMFPGYLFMVTDALTELQLQLQNVPGLTRLLGTGDEIIPLNDREIRFLKQFGGEDHVVEMSEGIIENSTVIIQSGPLAGWEAYIKKIDRHKRKAYLEMEMFGRIQKVEVGLEIFAKVEKVCVERHTDDD